MGKVEDLESAPVFKSLRIRWLRVYHSQAEICTVRLHGLKGFSGEHELHEASPKRLQPETPNSAAKPQNPLIPVKLDPKTPIAENSKLGVEPVHPSKPGCPLWKLGPNRSSDTWGFKAWP